MAYLKSFDSSAKQDFEVISGAFPGPFPLRVEHFANGGATSEGLPEPGFWGFEL